MLDLLVLMFTYLPSVLIHIVLGTGMFGISISYLISAIPFIATYKAEIKYCSIILIILGFYLEGGMAVNNDYMEKAKEWNNKIEIAEVKAKDANAKIEYIYKDRIIKEKQIQVIYKDRIKLVTKEIDKDCKVDEEAIKIMNGAAKDLK